MSFAFRVFKRFSELLDVVLPTNGAGSSYLVYNFNTGRVELGATPQATSGQGANLIYDDTFSGVINGANAVFNTSRSFLPSKTAVYLNGLRMKRGASLDYIESGQSQITFNSPPEINSNIVVDFSY